jgi:uncharacterized membrane protein YGL010W
MSSTGVLEDGMKLDALLDEYEQNHQSAACRISHAFGIPLILFALPVALFKPWHGLTLFTLGWLLQFAGHVAEGKRPKFFEGPQYLLAGVLWWLRLVSAPLRAL